MLVQLLWVAVAAYAVHRIATVVERFAPNAPGAVPPFTQVEEVVIPDDLMAFAMSQSEQWAQEEAVRAIQQNYELWKDWNRVRAAMSIGRMPS
jgi:hypothetical protein